MNISFKRRAQEVLMIITYYYILFFLSYFLTLIFITKWNKYCCVYFILLYALIPVANTACLLLMQAKTIEEALAMNKIVYLTGCFIPIITVLCILYLCKIELKRYIIIVFFSLTLIFYMCIMFNPKNLYYKSVSIVEINGISHLVKDYGPLHALFFVHNFFYTLIGLIAIIFSYLKKKNVSLKNLYALFLTILTTLCFYYCGGIFTKKVELVSLSYVINQIIYLFIVQRTVLYNIDDTVANSYIEEGSIGFISFDKKMKYLGCNKTAEKYIPELITLRIDKTPNMNMKIFKDFSSWVDEISTYENSFLNNNNSLNIEKIIERDETILKILVGNLVTGKKRCGYQFIISDVTKEQKYLNLLSNYNKSLKEKVTEKTEHITAIQDKMILNIADILENRDISTGGHIKRTSQIVKILIDAMKEDNDLGLTDEFCENMIKAASMHDLGKIAVEDAILRKPGKFTSDEYEQMKTHTSKGADIVKNVLYGINEENFQIIAQNVAHYHHERWDGSGYPEGLKGDQIPLEARIMSIADVYDALVSKRCYKERMSFEQAFEIIEEGMGKQFDDGLNKYFIKSRKILEDFYRDIEYKNL